MTKRALLLGGTGAMGIYLAPILLEKGFEVDVTTRTARRSRDRGLRFIQGDAHDKLFVEDTLRRVRYDIVVDFMVYSTDEFYGRYELLLTNCSQYIFLSSYRVFAECDVITEESPRLLDTSADEDYLATNDYSLEKARQEDILRAASQDNWTIIRPAITYSRGRFQLGTLESGIFVWRAIKGYPVILPKDMLNKKTTMTWAGDVARLIAELVLNKKAYGDDFNVATGESHTWLEVAEIYENAIDLKLQPVSTDDYIESLGGGYNEYQVKYDRMYNRILDNNKILSVTGERQESFIKLEDGLRRELTCFINDPQFDKIDCVTHARIDRLTKTRVNQDELTAQEKEAYMSVNPTLPYLAKRKTSQLKSRIIGALHRLLHEARNMKRALRLRTRAKNFISNIYSWKVAHREWDGAILTLSGYFNYGNILQRYALQKFLTKKGYNFVSYFQKAANTDDVAFGSSRQAIKDFVKQYIITKSPNGNDRYKNYIVGSDQVWRNWDYPDEQTELGYYFFNFIGDQTAKKIAYAASFGVDTLKAARISDSFVDYIGPFIRQFTAIGMREESGVDLVKQTWGVDARKVVDPTMLLTASDYSILIDKSPHTLQKPDGIFTYFLHLDESRDVIVANIGETAGYKVTSFAPKAVDTLPPVEQWLIGFRDAKIVITDSFHGVVFAIINNTPFVVLENAAGGLTRIKNLLEQFGLEDRLVENGNTDSFLYENLPPIDWDGVNIRLDEYRKDSGDWLIKNIET